MHSMQHQNTLVSVEDKVIKEFLAKISPLEPQIARMHLFGSRARKDWRPDSDYDILIVLQKKERSVIDKLYDAVLEVLLSTGRLISLKIFSESEFNRLRSIPTPFVSNVLKDGIQIGRDI